MSGKQHSDQQDHPDDGAEGDPQQQELAGLWDPSEQERAGPAQGGRQDLADEPRSEREQRRKDGHGRSLGSRGWTARVSDAVRCLRSRDRRTDAASGQPVASPARCSSSWSTAIRNRPATSRTPYVAWVPWRAHPASSKARTVATVCPRASAKTARISVERLALQLRRGAGLRPVPQGVVIDGDLREPDVPDRTLHRDQVAHDFARSPLPGRHGPSVGEPSGHGQALRERGELHGQLGGTHRLVGRHRPTPRRPGSEPTSVPPRRAGRPSGRHSPPAGPDRSDQRRSSGSRDSTGSTRRPPPRATSRTIR